MTKLEQQQWMQQLGLPVPPFVGLSFDAFRTDTKPALPLRPPLAVRSSFSAEDGDQNSYAGHFVTRLSIAPEALPEAIHEVFDSYPRQVGESVLIQEQVEADFSGVVFAWRTGVWRVELIPGAGEQLVSGKVNPDTFLLPRFDRMDVFFARWWPFWQGLPNHPKLTPSLIELSSGINRLLREAPDAPGLDVEFCIAKGKLYFLQARPLTTPEEEEHLLTSANHKEILPERPSALMRDLIARSGPRLYDYYRQFDSTLPAYSFIHSSGGMPWINLSALLDTMIHWGIPTRLVTDNVGADDPYRVGIRPWRVIAKLGPFFGAARKQLGAVRQARQWTKAESRKLPLRQTERATTWADRPAEAFDAWWEDAGRIYVGLVSQMQGLTAAVSGGLALLNRLNLADRLDSFQSRSSDYFQAYRRLRAGQLPLEEFLAEFGHRGFYESDLGQRRFSEWADTEWAALLDTEALPPSPKKRERGTSVQWLLQPIATPLLAREALRHEAMHLFAQLRRELLDALPAPPDPFESTFSQLSDQLSGKPVPSHGMPQPVGWDMDTFLANQLGRRLPVESLATFGTRQVQPLGIYPGQVRGRVWRVHQVDQQQLQLPAFRPIVLVADALSPGFIPYFSEVDAVVAYTGGLLSHAAIVLREQQIPSVTQLAPDQTFRTGDWVEVDGRIGKVVTINAPDRLNFS